MIDKIMDRLARSPLGRKLESEQRAEDLAARRGWVEARARLRADFDRQHPPLRDALVAAEARLAAAEIELAQARQDRAGAALAVTALSLKFDARDGSLVRRLRTAPHRRDRQGREVPCDPDALEALCALCQIRALKSRLLARSDAAIAMTETPEPGRGPVNPVTMRTPEVWHTNAAENRLVTAAATAACRRLDALELEILSDDEALRAQLAEIEASVPRPTDLIPRSHAPDMTPAEAREFAWREAAR